MKPTEYKPAIDGITPELLALLRDQLRTCKRYHRTELIRRTLKRLAIVDLTAQGFSRRQIVQTLRCGNQTVTTWRRRVQKGGLDAILDRLSVKKPGPRH